MEFGKFSEFPKGTVYDILCDAYSYDAHFKEMWEDNWKDTDDFIYGNIEIADKYGFIISVNGYPIGFIIWDPRNIPEYAEIGHNGIREAYKRQGYGNLQLMEAVRRIRANTGIKKITVCTNDALVAKKNYENAGFKLCRRVKDNGYAGDYLYYEMRLIKDNE